ncbi:MAG: hypothetical protein ACKVU1_04740 [bacterium]
MRRAAESLALAAFAIVVFAGLTIWSHRVNGAMPLLTDEVVLLWQSRTLADGHLSEPVPTHPEFVNVTSIVTRGDRRFGQYPAGFPLVAAPWVAVGAAWLVNILLGVASLLLMFRFARQLAGARIAWLSALLLAASPFFVAQSTAYFAQPPLLVLSLVMLIALQSRERGARATLFAFVAGAAIGYAINVSPFTAITFAAVAAERWVAARRVAPATRAQAAAFAAGLLLGVAAFCAVNAATTGSPWLTGYYDSRPTERAGFGEDVGEAGHSPQRAVEKTFQRVRLLNEFLFGWPLTSCGFAILYLVARLARRARRGRQVATPAEGIPVLDWDRALMVLFVSTLVVFAFWYFHGNGPSWGPRYLYPALPALILFTARGLDLLAAWCAPIFGTRARLAYAVPFATAALLFVVGTAPFLRRLADDDFLRMRRATRRLVDQLAAEGIDRGTIFVGVVGRTSFNAQIGLLGATGFSDSRPLVFARDRGGDANAAFVAWRGGGPAYEASFVEETFQWRIEPFGGEPRFRPGAASRGGPAERRP